MITKVHIRGFRCFKELVFDPDEMMNIIVGGNEAGKSTILEAISMALTGRVNGGRWAGDLLNPYWFNKDLVAAFFDDLEAGKKPKPPEFRIDVYLDVERGDTEKMRGVHNMLKHDSVGITLHARPDAEYAQEFEEYLAADECPRVLPVEYYQLEWHDFALTPLHRKPKDLNIAVIDSQTIRSERALDYYTKQLLEERLDERARGSMHGATLSNLTRENFARAVIEATVAGQIGAVDQLRKCGVEPRRLMVIGGAGKSRAVQLITSEIAGMPVVVPAPDEYVARGAALQAAWALTSEVPEWQVTVSQVPATKDQPQILEQRQEAMRALGYS